MLRVLFYLFLCVSLEVEVCDFIGVMNMWKQMPSIKYILWFQKPFNGSYNTSLIAFEDRFAKPAIYAMEWTEHLDPRLWHAF